MSEEYNHLPVSSIKLEPLDPPGECEIDNYEQSSNGFESLSDDEERSADKWALLHVKCPQCCLHFTNLRAHVPYCLGAKTEKTTDKIEIYGVGSEQDDDFDEDMEDVCISYDEGNSTELNKIKYQPHGVISYSKPTNISYFTQETDDNILTKKTDEVSKFHEPRNICKYCLLKFPPNQLISHSKFHCEMKPFCCPKCKFRFRYNAGLSRHLMNNNCFPLDIECNTCLRRFRSKSQLQLHFNKLNCKVDVCSKQRSLEEAPNLRSQNQRIDVNQLLCDFFICCKLCMAPCESIKDLEDHRAYYCSGIRKSCGKCGINLPKTSPTDNVLASSFSKYTCPCCHHSFGSLREFQCHVTSSCSFLPFSCRHCPERFLNVSSRNNHEVQCYPASMAC